MPVSARNREYLELVVLHVGLPGDYVGIVLGAIRLSLAGNAHRRPFLEEDLQDVAIDLLLELGGGPWRSARGLAIDSAAAEGMRYFKVALRHRLTNFVTRELPAHPDEPLEVLRDEPASPGPFADDELPSLHEIHAAIRTLGFVDRVVVGYLIEGRAQRDIARITGLSRSDLNRRVQRIRRRLARVLGLRG